MPALRAMTLDLGFMIAESAVARVRFSEERLGVGNCGLDGITVWLGMIGWVSMGRGTTGKTAGARKWMMRELKLKRKERETKVLVNSLEIQADRKCFF